MAETIEGTDSDTISQLSDFIQTIIAPCSLKSTARRNKIRTAVVLLQHCKETPSKGRFNRLINQRVTNTLLTAMSESLRIESMIEDSPTLAPKSDSLLLWVRASART